MRRFVVLVEWVDRAAAAEGRVQLDAEWTKAGAAVWSGQLAPIRAHGSWHGTEPFRPGTGAETNATLVLSLTYAQIRLRRLGHFYFVGFPRAARRMTRPPSPMIAGVGFGDVPIRHACTISIWPSAEALDEIAYGATEPHGEIARRSVDGGWLSESLFARFAVVSESGSWSDR